MDEILYLGLDDLLVIASAVLHIEAVVVGKMANLIVADVAVHALMAWRWRVLQGRQTCESDVLQVGRGPRATRLSAEFSAMA